MKVWTWGVVVVGLAATGCKGKPVAAVDGAGTVAAADVGADTPGAGAEGKAPADASEKGGDAATPGAGGGDTTGPGAGDAGPPTPGGDAAIQADALAAAGADGARGAADGGGADGQAATDTGGADGGQAAADTNAPEEVVPAEAWTLVAPVGMPTSEPTTGACVPGVADLFGPGFMWPVLTDRKLELCGYGDDQVAKCLALDLDSGVVTPIKKTPRRFVDAAKEGWTPPSHPDTRVSRGGKRVEARVGAGKKAPFKALDTAGMGVDRVVANERFYAVSPSAWRDDLSVLPDAKVMTFSRETGERLAQIPLSDLAETSCPILSFAGDLLYVEAGVCAGPGAVGLFVDPGTGKVVHKLGGLEQSASAYGVTPVALPDGNAAFREQYGFAIFVHDGKTGAHLRTVNLSASLKKGEDGSPLGQPEGGAMFRLDKKGGELEALVVLQPDRVLLVDANTWTVTRVLGLTGCPSSEE